MDESRRVKIRSELKKLLKQGELEAAQKDQKEFIEHAKIYNFGPAQKYLIMQAYVENDDKVLQNEFDRLLPVSSYRLNFEEKVLKSRHPVNHKFGWVDNISADDYGLRQSTWLAKFLTS